MIILIDLCLATLGIKDFNNLSVITNTESIISNIRNNNISFQNFYFYKRDTKIKDRLLKENHLSKI